MKSNTQVPVEQLYKSRENFLIIGLTGLAGSGCSTLANIMADENFFLNEKSVRTPSSLPFSCNTHVTNTFKEEEIANIEATSQLVFKRKYSICYNFVKENYKPFQIIKYTHVVVFYSLLYIIEKRNIKESSKLKECFVELLEDKFFPMRKADKKYKEIRNYTGTSIDLKDVVDQIDWDGIYASLETLLKNKKYFVEDSNHRICNSELSNYFFNDSQFKKFVTKLIELLYKEDYYCSCFLFHRLSFCIRNFGDPFKKSQEAYDNPDNSFNNLYVIVKMINHIIKGMRQGKDNTTRRVVIDSIRNSMEGLYLKERFSAFYLIAVHDNENRELHLREKVANSISSCKIKQTLYRPLIDEMCSCMFKLTETEVENKDYEDGKFHSPNISQCISDAEIHISNSSSLLSNVCYFNTMEEQWMKYAALIQHPGLITPSSEERCMIVAYTAKFNSGCLSRQVGACITNSSHSIRTIGWNDVPYGQIPCSLRELDDLESPSKVSKIYYKYMYSEYERGAVKYFQHDNQKCNFTEMVNMERMEIDAEDEKTILKGLPHSFCFKTLQNRYEAEKNQVYTRSLHAEENAMLQMVRFGGEALSNGIIYVTASPCELCAKKLYQIGVRKIVYIEPYPGISRKQIIASGFKRPELKLFQGAYGSAYFKLYQPFISYKDELTIRLGKKHELKAQSTLLQKMLRIIGKELKPTYSQDEIDEILDKFSCNKN